MLILNTFLKNLSINYSTIQIVVRARISKNLALHIEEIILTKDFYESNVL